VNKKKADRVLEGRTRDEMPRGCRWRELKEYGGEESAPHGVRRLEQIQLKSQSRRSGACGWFSGGII